MNNVIEYVKIMFQIEEIYDDDSKEDLVDNLEEKCEMIQLASTHEEDKLLQFMAHIFYHNKETREAMKKILLRNDNQ